jgi:hypothetical protein
MVGYDLQDTVLLSALDAEKQCAQLRYRTLRHLMNYDFTTSRFHPLIRWSSSRGGHNPRIHAFPVVMLTFEEYPCCLLFLTSLLSCPFKRQPPLLYVQVLLIATALAKDHFYVFFTRPHSIYCWSSRTRENGMYARHCQVVFNKWRTNERVIWIATILCAPIKLLFIDSCRFASYAPIGSVELSRKYNSFSPSCICYWYC